MQNHCQPYFSPNNRDSSTTIKTDTITDGIPNGSFNPALATSAGIEDASFFTTNCFGTQTLPTADNMRSVILVNKKENNRSSLSNSR